MGFLTGAVEGVKFLGQQVMHQNQKEDETEGDLLRNPSGSLPLQSQSQMVKNWPAMQEVRSPSWGDYPGKRDGYPLQDSCLENSMDRGAWRATVHGVAKSWTQLSNFHFLLE